MKGAISGIFAATGQTCIAGSRLLVQELDPRRVRSTSSSAFATTARMGDPMQCRDPGRADHHAAAVQEDARLHRHRQRRGRAAACSAAARAKRPECGDGWFVEPTIFSRRQQPDADRARGGLRPGPVGHPLPRRRGGDRHRQRHALRPRRRRVDAEHQARAHDVGAAAGRHGVGQHLPRGELHVALRRLQALAASAARTARTRSGNICRPRASGFRPPTRCRTRS